MLRRIMFAAATSSMLLLAGCAHNPDGSVNPGASIGNVIAETQSIATQICRFVPTAQTVANILSAGNPALQTAGSIASAICNAVSATTARRGAVAPNVAGVRIAGHFVR